MSLRGRGVLAIWNNIAAGAEAQFVAWHVTEHIPERVGLEGFTRGRRYIALAGAPRYFNFYEGDSAQTFESAAYRARLDAPTAWTRQVVAHFSDTSRTVCEVVESLGLGSGGFMATFQLDAAAGEALRRQHGRELARMLAQPGIVGVHLLQGLIAPAGAAATAETRLRAGPDAQAQWIVLVESVQPEALEAVAVPGRSERGIYQLQYALSKEDMMREPRPT